MASAATIGRESMSTLGRAALARLPAQVATPRYALDTARIGVVHFGPGAFHRAHQAWYFDDALATDPRWAVSAVSLKSPKLRDTLAPQDGLYTVGVLDEPARYRVIGALRERLVAGEDRERVFARLAAPTTTIVTVTVTEKGYCLRADGTLDVANADIVADLAAPRAPASLIGHLVEALERRRAVGLAPFTTIACDNLTDNGGRLGRAVVALARARDEDLARWIEAEAAFPRTMVDCIVPATDAALQRRAEAVLGVADAWPVQREAFSQWIVENRFCNVTPDWDALGVVVTADVGAYEAAKLRLVNGAHSTLAYLGSLAGHTSVADAMADTDLAAFVERLMREEIRPNVPAPPQFDLDAYIGDVLRRFRNPVLRHQLAQIAWDGSQKLPFRILATIRDALAARRPIAGLCVPVGAWLQFVRRAQRDGGRLVDPLADRLLATAAACSGDPVHDVALFLAIEQVFAGDLPRDRAFVAALQSAYQALGSCFDGQRTGGGAGGSPRNRETS